MQLPTLRSVVNTLFVHVSVLFGIKRHLDVLFMTFKRAFHVCSPLSGAHNRTSKERKERARMAQ